MGEELLKSEIKDDEVWYMFVKLLQVRVNLILDGN